MLEYLGEADGIRRLMGLLLDAMKPPGADRLVPIIRGDAIVYFTEVIQCNAIFRMHKALTLVVGTLRPGDGYPTVMAKSLRLLDALFHAPGNGNGYLQCSVIDKLHVCGQLFLTSGGDDPYVPHRWTWPEHDCQENNFLGQEERCKLVRALAYPAGVVKMSGEAFSILSTEILHDMAVLLSSAFDLCNEECGDVIMEESDGEKSDDGELDNEPFPMTDGPGEAEAMEMGGRQFVNAPLYRIDASEEHEDNPILKLEDEIPLSMLNCPGRDRAKVPEGPPVESEFVIVPCHNKDDTDELKDSSGEMDDYISGEDDVKMMEGSLNYCANYCPSKGYKFVIIPRHIKDAAALMGMRPILGFGSFGFEWAAEDDEFRYEEIEGVFAQYCSLDNSESED